MPVPRRRRRARLPLVASAVLLYDGECGFCSSSVAFVLRHDHRAKTLRFAPLAGELGRKVVAEHPELQGVDSMIWFEPDGGTGRVRVRSEAALLLCGYLGGGFKLLGWFGRLVPRSLRDAAYSAIAARRKSLPGAASCSLPTSSERARFLA